MELIEHATPEWLGDRIETARAVSPKLFLEICASSERLVHLTQMGKARRLQRLIDSEAWTEAALELVALAAPEWTVQRLCKIDGEWLCSLTRFPDMPDWLDDFAEATHATLALAILGALANTRLLDGSPRHPPMAPNPGLADAGDYR